ncbi:hypothetical protein B0H19DRAFT_1228440 [Mycena capillaripes]|nr:hypothetical protein B0H19DRAFT_1228440 [Mycena capillaripes]
MPAAISEDWVLIFVSEHLFSHKFSSVRRVAFSMAGKRVSTPTLPPELWICIHRLAVLDISPLAKVYADDDVIKHSATPEDPVNDHQLQRFLRAVCSLRRVCRLWSELAQELLYENVWVNKRWPSLFSGLEKLHIARLVRSVRLSTTRFDHNALVLQQCTQIEVLVQPEFPRSERLYSVTEVELPPLLFLKRLYWIESWWSSPLLHSVLRAAPNLEHISLSSSSTIGFDPALEPTFPSLPHLRTLALPQLSTQCVRALLRTDLAQLTHLTITPAHLDWPAFPILPALRTLALVEHPAPTRVPFPAILAHCPSLCELRHNARAVPVMPDAKQTAPALVCVRMHLGDGRTMPPALPLYATMLLGPAFGALECVALDGPGWVNRPMPWSQWEQLQKRGIRVEQGIK